MQKKFNDKLPQLMLILSDGEFHDGTALGEKLQITRSAVWKIMKKLERYGLQFESIKGKGYSLREPMILLEDKLIRAHLQDKKLRLHLFESLDSTNIYLKSLQSNRTIQFCISEQQTEGRGRLGRDWYSPFGKNIYLSCLYPFQKDVSELAGLSLVVSLAVLRTLQQFGIDQDVHVKWPNDIICQMKKMAGSLIDVQAESNGASQAIIGIGINVNMLHEQGDNISQPWISMREVSGTYMDRNQIIGGLINHMLAYLNRFDKEGFNVFIEEWNAAEGMQNKKIALKTLNETISGVVTGINAQGHLLLKMHDGQIRAFSSGDASIQK